MSAIRGVKDRRFKFTQLLNSMLEDPGLSLKAKGFIGYCLTKPEDWVFRMSHLTTALLEGERAIYAVINECIEKGYAIRYQPHSPHGDFLPWETIISDSKYEIEERKKELLASEEFQKSVALRCFAGAQDTVPQNAPPSNTYSSNDISKDISKGEKKEGAAPPAAKAAPLSSLPSRDVVLSSEEKATLFADANGDDSLLEGAIKRYSDWKATAPKSKLPKSDFLAIRKWAIKAERKERAEKKRTELIEKQNQEMEKRLNSPKTKGAPTYLPPTPEEASRDAKERERKPEPPMSLDQRLKNMKLFYPQEEWEERGRKMKEQYEKEVKEWEKKWNAKIT